MTSFTPQTLIQEFREFVRSIWGAVALALVLRFLVFEPFHILFLLYHYSLNIVYINYDCYLV